MGEVLQMSKYRHLVQSKPYDDIAERALRPETPLKTSGALPELDYFWLSDDDTFHFKPFPIQRGDENDEY